VKGYSGARQGRGFGAGLDFADYRNYAPGDDPRRIDWKGYARSGRLFTKLFIQEKQASVCINIDRSRSMDYGMANKMRFAKLLSATIAYLALKNSDRVILFPMDGTQSLEVSAKTGFDAVLAFLEHMEPVGTDGRPQLRQGTPASLEYTLSDFLYEDISLISGFVRPGGYACHILDATELSPKLTEQITLRDAETHRELVVTPEMLVAYHQALDKLRDRISDVCKKTHAHYTRLQTDTDMLLVLSSLYYVGTQP